MQGHTLRAGFRSLCIHNLLRFHVLIPIFYRMLTINVTLTL